MPFAPSRLEVITKHLSDKLKVRMLIKWMLLTSLPMWTTAYYDEQITPKPASNSSMSDNPLTSHVLDTATGRPAANMRVVLHKLHGDGWQEVVSKVTNSDGRAGYFIPQAAFTQGTYKMFFDTGAYFEQLAVKGFYPYVEIVFVIENPEDHYHIPLLISPYGYSTYRGS